ncbi:Ku protein [Limoniibacter endophyticus]|uniref:Non-homologous end joining protein Ku n=1 Tax=Limoniibacter endophyticus TaxID=1565040 RepID=A0A8J3DR37_9HYPH|nr:Ku protein [Limoniibacter endophyticus]GHC75565.1 non-homologous end joining protein Ku [Limoniibacter endophyticus]
MAPRPFWRGYLKLSLVTCAVTMTPATSDSAKVRFHTLNRKTGNRVASRYVDSVTHKPVDEDDEVKGYPLGEDEHIMLEEEEIEAVALESTRTIDIETFVPVDSIEWIWYDKPHYLAPSDAVGEEAFSVIRAAMEATKTAGIARLVMYRRERAVLLKPYEQGIVVWTLHYADEVRDETDYFAEDDDRPKKQEMTLVRKLIDARMKKWSPDMVSDPVQAKLKDIIAAKKKGRKKPAKKTAAKQEEKPSNVISIMDALKKSIAAEKKGKSS